MSKEEALKKLNSYSDVEKLQLQRSKHAEELEKEDNIWTNPKKNALLKEHQKEALFKLYDIPNEMKEEVFMDFWEKLNSHKFINMIDYCAYMGIKRKVPIQ